MPSMEIITGVAPAEYGDKSSLSYFDQVGSDQSKPAGSMELRVVQEYRSRANVGGGSHDRRLRQRAADESSSSRIHRSARPGQRRIVLQPLRRPHRRYERSIQPAVPGVRRPAYVRPRTTARATSADQRSTSRPAIRRSSAEDAVHGQRVRATGPSDMRASADPSADQPASVSQDQR